MTDTTTTVDTSAADAAFPFYNFDGCLSGATAKAVKDAARARGISPADLLATLLREAIGAHWEGGETDDVKVEPMTINTGNGGFHVVTVVADGYGYYVAENSAGDELARVKVEEDDDLDGPQVFHRLMTAWNSTIDHSEG